MTPPFSPQDHRIWVSKDGRLVVKSVLGGEESGIERVLISATSAGR
jgi:hypothetical protein